MKKKDPSAFGKEKQKILESFQNDVKKKREKTEKKKEKEKIWGEDEMWTMYQDEMERLFLKWMEWEIILKENIFE